jgi:hypothetical protein
MGRPNHRMRFSNDAILAQQATSFMSEALGKLADEIIER